MLDSQENSLKTPQSLISPLPSPSLQTISAEINTATRAVHTRLNKLTTSRLPLALPPYSDNPELYARGINAFAQIYFAFEARWHELIVQAKARDLGDAKHQDDVRAWLADLVPSGLWRSRAIRSDLKHISEVLDISLDIADGIAEVDSTMLEHIRKVTAIKPHTLVAYSWIMYMAIFSGGRWIRQQLREAGPAFWHVPNSVKSDFGALRQYVSGFSLFYFEGERDGEDIKADFKARLEMAEAVLTEQERNDITEEAQNIFNMCIDLVDRLDDELATPKQTDADSNLAWTHARASLAQTQVLSGSKAKASSTRGHGLLTALLAVLLAFFTCYAWTWI
ncbi:hypothetical protein BDV97DRAFT_359152 [Delphinella strobiligena]|nr:hypothetical protein BDV97DRAFT_359152 [Delphinella strobiligena]